MDLKEFSEAVDKRIKEDREFYSRMDNAMDFEEYWSKRHESIGVGTKNLLVRIKDFKRYQKQAFESGVEYAQSRVLSESHKS